MQLLVDGAPSVSLAAITVVVYLLTLFCLTSLSSAPAFARGRVFTAIAFAHNALLCIGSLWMHILVYRAVISVSRSNSFSETICNPRDAPLPPIVSQTFVVFYLSKFYELLDSVILALRSRRLTLLHVWHHSSVIFEVFAWRHFRFSLGLYGMWFNTLVHIVMYAYYACTLYKIPFPFKKYITTTQICQFITGFASTIPWLYLHRTTGCAGLNALLIAALINGSYLFLFIQFYRRTYKSKPTKES